MLEFLVIGTVVLFLILMIALIGPGSEIMALFTPFCNRVLQILGFQGTPGKSILRGTGAEGLVGRIATVSKPFEFNSESNLLIGKVSCDGAIWDAVASQGVSNSLECGEEVKIINVDGLKVVVELFDSQ